MLELLKPFELFFDRVLPAGLLRTGLFHLFRVMHLYLEEYTDYLLFGILFVPLYYLVPRRFRPLYLLAASLVMLTVLYGAVFTVLLWAVPLAFFFAFERAWAQAAPERRSKLKWPYGLGVLTVYLLLIARESFSYEPVLPWLDRPLILPLLHFCGIAFMLPKLLHYLFDRADSRLERAATLDFSLYILFFPILRLGPIERFPSFARDLQTIRRERVASFDIAYGLFRIALGAFKNILYAAWLYPYREYISLHIGTLPWEWLYLACLYGILEVYCHFGGYSDLAIGFGRLFGFRFTENFFEPFLSTSIAEWWRRWHITLSFWLRDYVYRPLGGSKHAFRNILITFVVCGAWHYLAWHYILWGALQAVGLAGHGVWRATWTRAKRRALAGKAPHVLPFVRFGERHPALLNTAAVVLTLHYFCLSGVYFIFSVREGTLMLWRILTFAN